MFRLGVQMKTSLLLSAVLGVLLLSTVLVNGINAQEKLQASDLEFNLFGKVIDAETSAPIMAFIVLHGGLEDSFKYELKTDREGSFKASVPSGEVFLLIEAEGYSSLRESLKVSEKEPIKVEFSLKKIEDLPESNLFGKLISEKDEGILGVVTFQMENVEGISVRSDEEGQFEAFLTPGNYFWYAEAKGFEPVRGEITVPRGEPVRLAIKMVFVKDEIRSGAIAGRTMGPKGEPLPHTKILISHLEVKTASTDKAEKEIWVESDERGSFKMELPLGAYHLKAIHEGFEPFIKGFKLTKEDPVLEMKIVLKMVSEPKGIQVHMEYTDRNSDGNPEKLIITADVNGDDRPDLTIEMLDTNSDGNPESVVFDMDLPADQMTEILFKVLEMASQMPPFSNHPGMDPMLPRDPVYDDSDDRKIDETPDIPDRNTAFERDQDLEEEKDTDKSMMMPDDGGDVKETISSDKGSEKENGSDLFLMIGSISLLLALISLVMLGGYAIRSRKVK